MSFPQQIVNVPWQNGIAQLNYGGHVSIHIPKLPKSPSSGRHASFGMYIIYLRMYVILGADTTFGRIGSSSGLVNRIDCMTVLCFDARPLVKL